MHDHTFFYACESPDQAACNLSGQRGDCRWPLNLPQGLAWVCMGYHAPFITT